MNEKYLTKRFAKKMMLIGVGLVALTFILSIVIAWNIYGYAGKSYETVVPNTGAINSLSLWETAAKINVYAQIAGFIIFGLGIINFIAAKLKLKR